MKFLTYTLITCFALIVTRTSAQEVSHESFLGNWKYKSPKGKTEQTYGFQPDKTFTVITEYKNIESKTEGTFEVDQKANIHRLKLTTIVEGDKSKSQIKYYFFKFLTADSAKLQEVTDKQEAWKADTRKNKIILIRQKEKDKSK